jgi:hypothetical protein
MGDPGSPATICLRSCSGGSRPKVSWQVVDVANGRHGLRSPGRAVPHTIGGRCSRVAPLRTQSARRSLGGRWRSPHRSTRPNCAPERRETSRSKPHRSSRRSLPPRPESPLPWSQHAPTRTVRTLCSRAVRSIPSGRAIGRGRRRSAPRRRTVPAVPRRRGGRRRVRVRSSRDVAEALRPSASRVAEARGGTRCSRPARRRGHVRRVVRRASG